MLFENCRTSMDQGNIGESRAIYELTKMGYGLYKPLYHNVKADFIAERDGKLYKVQVKTSNVDRKTPNGGFAVQLASRGGNTKVNTIRQRHEGDYDLLFVLHKTGRCWLIPAEALGEVNTAVAVGGPKYKEFEIDTDLPIYPEVNRPSFEGKRLPPVTDLDVEAVKKAFVENDGKLTATIKSLGYKSASTWQRDYIKSITHDIILEIKQECKHFTKEELEQMMKDTPVYKIAESCGLTDNAVHRWAKKWGLK